MKNPDGEELWVRLRAGVVSTMGCLTISFTRTSDSLSDDVSDFTADFGRSGLNNMATVLQRPSSTSEPVLFATAVLGHPAGFALVDRDKSRGLGIKISSV